MYVNSSSTWELIVWLWNYLGSRRQKQFILLSILMIISAIADVVSLGALLPFLGILVAPERVFQNHFVTEFVVFFNITSPQQLIFPLTIMFVIISLVAGLIRIVFAWISNTLVCVSGAELSRNIYKTVLYQPYKKHITRNSSEIINLITKKVDNVTFRVIRPLLILISSIVLLAAILSLLFIVNFKLASTLFFSFGLSYGFTAYLSNRQLKHNGAKIAFEQTIVYKSIQEGLGGIRDVILDNSQNIYCDIYNKSDLELRYAQGKNEFLSQSPRFLIETLIMIFIAVIANFLSHKDGGLAVYIPTLGVLAIGAQRIIPILQQMYQSWANIMSTKTEIYDVMKLLKDENKEISNPLNHEIVTFNNSIQFVNAKFRYSENNPWVLDGFNLTIPKNTMVGFVGSTGSGKSTIFDILMGLLPLNDGQLLVDGKVINNKNVRAWQTNIAHVPQHIFLSDNSFAQNIAFGVSFDKIDIDRVKVAAKQAQIEDFIESCPSGYNTIIGERGALLSGGQRQRIGIARALYKNASVLVFDEATSALDNETEQFIMDEITSLNGDFTILIIAHRLNTLRHCDSIIELSNGKVLRQGTYDQLFI